jgi:hypothetical protein
MTAKRIDLEVWVCVDSNGDYGTDNEADGAIAAYEDSIGPLNQAEGFRLVKLTVGVPLPVALELFGSVADDQPATLTTT